MFIFLKCKEINNLFLCFKKTESSFKGNTESFLFFYYREKRKIRSLLITLRQKDKPSECWKSVLKTYMMSKILGLMIIFLPLMLLLWKQFIHLKNLFLKLVLECSPTKSIKFYSSVDSDPNLKLKCISFRRPSLTAQIPHLSSNQMSLNQVSSQVLWSFKPSIYSSTTFLLISLMSSFEQIDLKKMPFRS